MHLVSAHVLTVVKSTHIILQHPCDSLALVLLKALVHQDHLSELDHPGWVALLLPSFHSKVLLLHSVVFKHKVRQEEAFRNKVDSSSRHLVDSHSKVSRL